MRVGAISTYGLTGRADHAASSIAQPSMEAMATTSNYCGPMDVVFVIDNTGGMGDALSSGQTGMDSIISQIQTASNGDYRLGVIAFWNDVEVFDQLAANDSPNVQARVGRHMRHRLEDPGNVLPTCSCGTAPSAQSCRPLAPCLLLAHR